MISIEFEDDLKQIANILGYVEQSMQLIEEMAELTQSINKFRRYKTEDTKNNLIEEIADVSIVLYQLAYLLPVDKEEFNKIIDYKIQRTKKRIEKSGKNI